MITLTEKTFYDETAPHITNSLHSVAKSCDKLNSFQKQNTDEIWILSRCNSDSYAINMWKISGDKEYVKQIIADMVANDARNNAVKNPDNHIYEETINFLSAGIENENLHIDYVAAKLKNIEKI